MLKTTAVAIAATIVLSLESPAQQASWGVDPAHNMVVDAENLPDVIDETTLAWTIETNNVHQYPMPIIVGDKLIVCASAKTGRGLLDPDWQQAVKGGGLVTCFDLKDRTPLWQLVLPKKGYGLGTYGVCAAPTVEGDRIYVLAMDVVLCLDLDGQADGNDGMGEKEELMLMTRPGYQAPEGREKPSTLPSWAADILWQYDIGGNYRISYQDAASSTIVLTGDQLWLATSHQLGTEARGQGKPGKRRKPDPAPHLLVIDKNTGKLIAEDSMDIPIVFHGEWSSPSLVELNGKKVVVFGDGYGELHGFEIPVPDKDGNVVKLKELWKIDLNPPEWRKNEEGKEYPYTNDGRLFFKYPEGFPDDPERWVQLGKDKQAYKTLGPCEIIGTPSVVGNRIYIGVGRDCYYNTRKPSEGEERLPGTRHYGRGRFMCLELEEYDKAPKIVWEDRVVSRTQCTASVVDGLVFIADTKGFLHCFDADTGEAHWRADLGMKVTCRSQVVMDGKVYVANDGSHVFVYRASKEKEKISESPIRGKEIASVTAKDGLLILSHPRQIGGYIKK